MTDSLVSPVSPVSPVSLVSLVKRPKDIHLLTTRFNCSTWRENEMYRERKGIVDGCVYGAPLRISHNISLMSTAYVIEMNNDTNRIEGIGRIKVFPNFDNPKSIYGHHNYNRYVYSGKCRLDRDILVRCNTDLVDTLERLLFTGKNHLKRGSGITRVSQKKQTQTTEGNTPISVASVIRDIFISYFPIEPTGPTESTKPTEPTEP
jgi:hypothetical protein